MCQSLVACIPFAARSSAAHDHPVDDAAQGTSLLDRDQCIRCCAQAASGWVDQSHISRHMHIVSAAAAAAAAAASLQNMLQAATSVTRMQWLYIIQMQHGGGGGQTG
jgi:hypothetical protein